MIRNLDEIRSRDPKMYEALADLAKQQAAIAEQVNGNATGQPLAPPSISGIKVTGQNGHFQVAIQDSGPIYRDIHYYVEHADNPHFTNAQVVHMGHSRNTNLTLGNVTRYFRAYSAYASSAPGSPAYHGGAATPQPVNGGGPLGGPDFLPSEGSGTGTPDQGVSGPGPVPFRSPDGKPPIRGENPGVAAGGGNAIISPAAAGAPPSAPSSSSGGGGGGGSGVMQFLTSTQAGLAAIAAALGPSSLVTVYVSDYDHNLVWNGSGWRFGGGERSGYVEGFLVDPSPTTGWNLLDGSAVTYLKSDGTTGSVTLPDLVSAGNKAAYPKFGSPSSAVVNAAVSPTLTMNSYTPAGTVSQPTFTGNALGTHQHEIPYFFSGTNTVWRSNTSYGIGTSRSLVGYAVLTLSAGAGNVDLDQAVSAGTPSGTVSQPTFTGTAAVLTGTISATAEPQNMVLRPWFRR